ncbi:1-acyl-sn-glycerol-3-phosphate acyltransferase [Bacteroidota bacterium]
MAKKAIDRFSIRYTAFRTYVMFTHRLFYRKMQAKFASRIPKNRPVLLAPNHQNALMDAMGPIMTCRRDPIFLTRADVFNNKFIAGIFRVFKMLPVYRIRDGASELGKNEAIFQESMGALVRKKCPVAIMAEGNHGDKRRLRPLVKGIFRVAFQAQETYDEDPGVVIVPVGIDYTNYSNFRSHMFIQYGEPIEVNEYYAQYKENQARAMNTIRERLSTEMKKYIINIESEDHYDTYMLLRQVYNKRMRERLGFRKNDLYHRFLADQAMISGIASVEEKEQEKMSKLSEISKDYADGVDRLGMRDWVFRRKHHSLCLLTLADLGMLVTLPVFLCGFTTNYLIYWLVEMISRKIKDIQFRSSVKFVAGTLLFPIYYLILFIPVWIFTDPGWVKWAFLVSLPLTGLFAHTWYIWIKKLWSLWRYQFKTIARNKDLEKLKELRKQIVDMAESLIREPSSQNS